MRRRQRREGTENASSFVDAAQRFKDGDNRISR
jgi:hypothetical protein